MTYTIRLYDFFFSSFLLITSERMPWFILENVRFNRSPFKFYKENYIIGLSVCLLLIYFGLSYKLVSHHNCVKNLLSLVLYFKRYFSTIYELTSELYKSFVWSFVFNIFLHITNNDCSYSEEIPPTIYREKLIWKRSSRN